MITRGSFIIRTLYRRPCHPALLKDLQEGRRPLGPQKYQTKRKVGPEKVALLLVRQVQDPLGDPHLLDLLVQDHQRDLLLLALQRDLLLLDHLVQDHLEGRPPVDLR